MYTFVHDFFFLTGLVSYGAEDVKKGRKTGLVSYEGEDEEGKKMGEGAIDYDDDHDRSWTENQSSPYDELDEFVKVDNVSVRFNLKALFKGNVEYW